MLGHLVSDCVYGSVTGLILQRHRGVREKMAVVFG